MSNGTFAEQTMTTTDLAVNMSPTPPGTYDMSTTLTPDAAAPQVGQGAPNLSPEPDPAGKPESLQDVLADEVKKMKTADKADGENPAPAAEDAKAAKPGNGGKSRAKPDLVLEDVKSGRFWRVAGDEEARRKARELELTDWTVKPDGGSAETAADAAHSGDDPAEEDQARSESAGEAGNRKEEARAPQDEHRPDPPARFTDEAKRVWRNTPREVKAEIYRALEDAERTSATYREAARLHEDLRDYDAQAKSHGTSIKAALDRYVAFDRALMQDFGKGVTTLAREAGHSPEATVAQVLRAYGTTPQQYAQTVLRNPQAHQPSPPPPARDPLLAQIAQQNQLLLQRAEGAEQQQRLAAVQSQVEAWARDRPDYQALQGAIAEIIESGIVERIHGGGLSLVQRVEAAYRMAGGKVSRDTVPSPAPADPAPADAEARSPVDPGKRSVRGAPTNGLTPDTETPIGPLPDFFRRELRKYRA